MTERIVTRANTVFFAFTFYGEDDLVADVASAEMQLTYPGDSDFETETVTLTRSGDEWSATWDSSKSRSGWVEYHTHAIANDANVFTEDGKFRLRGNRANMDHDALPRSSRVSDYGFYP